MFEEYEVTMLHRILKPTTIVTEIVLGVLLLVTFYLEIERKMIF